MNIVGHWLTIKCFKHDGQPHRIWDRGLVLENTDDYIVVATKRAKVVEANGRRWFTKEPAVTIFSKKEWWNVICMIKKSGIVYYCNIASPSLIHEDSIEYIDYDLDAKLFHDNEILILDEKEYMHHRTSYNYPKELDKVLEVQTRKVVLKMKARQFPFDDAKINEYYNAYLEETKK